MKKTNNYELSLYDTTDKMSITAEENSLNANTKIIDNVLANKVDKVEGKGLSTNDFTTEEKNKLSSLSNYDDTQLTSRVAQNESDITSLQNNKANISDIPTDYVSQSELNAKGYLTSVPTEYKTKAENDNLYQEKGNYLTSIPSEYITNSELQAKGFATTSDVDNKDTSTLNSAKSYTDTKISTLINSAPETLDTLGELAVAFQENKSVVDTLNSAIGSKASQEALNQTNTNVSNLTTRVSNVETNKVDKVSGKSLIADTEITRLASVTNYDDTEIKNQINSKADETSIPTKTSQLTNDSGYLKSVPSEYVTETELNAKGYATESFVTNKIVESGVDDKTPPQYWINAINDIKDNLGNITTKGFESTVREKQNKAGADCVQFVWFSDTHIYPAHPRVLNICKVANYLCERCNIPLIAITGDLMSQDSPSSTVGVMNLFTAVQNVLNGAERERLMYIMGNHDGMWGSKVVNGSTLSYMKQLHHNEMYNILFREQATDFRRIFSNHGSYFYVDNIPQKFRFIMLDSHFDGDGSVDEEGYPIYNRMKTSCFGQEQLQWVADTALDMPEEYTAVLMMHSPSPQDISLLGKIITAYNSRTKYNNAGNPTVITGDFWGANVENSPYKNEVIDVDFTNAKGTIAAVFHGHIHKDSIDTTTLSVPLLGITTAGGDVRDTNAPTRTAGTATETAMDVVTINKKTKTIYMSRLGAGSDRDIAYGSDFTIDTELMNVSSSNLSIAIGKGNSYTTNLTANLGTIVSVVVTMGGKDITSEVYTQNADNKGGTISIPLVTGNITITANAESGNPFEVTSANWTCNSSGAELTLDTENQTVSIKKATGNSAYITCNNIFKRKEGTYSMSVIVNGSTATNACIIGVEAFDVNGNTLTDTACINMNNHSRTYNSAYKAFVTNSGYIPQIFTLTEEVDSFRLKFVPGSNVEVGNVAKFSDFSFTEPS